MLTKRFVESVRFFCCALLFLLCSQSYATESNDLEIIKVYQMSLVELMRIQVNISSPFSENLLHAGS